MNYQAIVKGMATNEINTRINNTGSEDFKKALEAELKARGEEVIEGTVVEPSESVQEESLEETNTNTKVDDKEPETTATEAPKPKRTRRSKTSQADSE